MGETMIRVNKIYGLLAENGMTQKEMAQKIGITQKTFREKMNKNVFKSNEIEVMISVLNIENPSEIFFAEDVAQ